MKKLIAKTNVGKEFMYYLSETYQSNQAKTDLFCKAMNKAGYKLAEGETWKVYNVDNDTYKHSNYKLVCRNNKLVVYEVWSVYA